MKNFFTLLIISCLPITTLATTTVCSKQDSKKKMTFSIAEKEAVLSGDGIKEEVFSISRITPVDKNDPDLDKAIGEVAARFTIYTVYSHTRDELNYMVEATGVSGTKYLGTIGPMGKVFILGTTASCK